MTKHLAIFIVALCPGLSLASELVCTEHENTLSTKPRGTEHVSHSVYLNGATPVLEIENGMWFVESVSCTTSGFKITASHKQYNEPTQKVFLLTVTGNGTYAIE